MARRGRYSRFGGAHSDHKVFGFLFEGRATAVGEMDLPEGKRPPSSQALRVFGECVRPRSEGHFFHDHNAYSSRLRAGAALLRRASMERYVRSRKSAITNSCIRCADRSRRLANMWFRLPLMSWRG